MTTPTTQREADERTLYKQWQSTNPTRTSTDGFEIWQARAAIDQTDAKTRMDAHTTSYAQGYRAGIDMGKAMAADERITIGNAMADLLHKLMRGYANRVPGDLINAGAALHRQWYATPTAPADSTTQHRNIAAALKGLANHVRACPEYRKLDGDMEFVDQAIIALESTPTAPQAASPIRGFDRSLASVDAYDPQSFIDGAKWAEEKFLAPQAASQQGEHLPCEIKIRTLTYDKKTGTATMVCPGCGREERHRLSSISSENHIICTGKGFENLDAPQAATTASASSADGYLNDDCDAPMKGGACTECGFGPCRRAAPGAAQTKEPNT